MSDAARTDPYLATRFGVDIEGVAFAGFAAVTGLGATVETETYAEGGVNTHVHVLPVRRRHPRIRLVRGLTDSPALLDWLRAGDAGTADPRDVRIELLSGAGESARAWTCADALPVRWAGPALRADRGTVAVEMLELAHAGLAAGETGGRD